MRKHGCPNGHGNMTMNNIVNNVTNNMQIVCVNSHDRRRSKRKHSRGNRNGHIEHKPSLLRYCASCGLLDGDRVMRMGDGEIVDGAVDVCNYAARDFGNNVRQIGSCAKGMAEDACDLVGGIWHLGKDVASLFSVLLG